MKYIADLHIHSPFSRATSKKSYLPGLFAWARVKGIHLVGTGDFTHPGWLSHLKEHLVSDGSGFFRFKEEQAQQALDGISPEQIPVRFVLSSEISSIYKKNGSVRKIHNLIFVPDFESVEKINARIAAIGNIESDGRPILGLDARSLLEIVLENAPEGFFVPAHIWTPWFSLFGSKSGFDSIEECFEDLTDAIFALETGLSSDPDMNRLVSGLDRFTLISNSDCHSPSKLGREANFFDTEFNFFSMRDSLKRNSEGFLGTIEFFPEEGKYHYDGHRKCKVCFDPEETQRHKGICPVCARPLTIGVTYRVMELADRKEPVYPQEKASLFKSLIPLQEVLGELLGAGSDTKGVLAEYSRVVSLFGSEFSVLMDTPLEEISSQYSPVFSESVKRIREGRVIRKPGYDGEFGQISLFERGEIDELVGQTHLFGYANKKQRGRKRVIQKPEKVKPEPENFEQYEKGLNPEQTQAVNTEDKRLILLAGPGTGKTFTLVERMTRQLEFSKIPPERFAAITFTNRAAREVKERLIQQVGTQAEDVFVGTFHAFCLKRLRQEEPELVVAGEETRAMVLQKCFPNMNRQQRAALDKEIKAYFSVMDIDNREVSQAVQVYIDELSQLKGVDLEAVIPLFVKKLRSESAFCDKVCASVNLLFIDEFQDLNRCQYELVKILAEGANVFAIGDPNQSIYGFRGSDLKFFYAFAQEFQAQALALVRNYRSAPAIIEAASAVIANNKQKSEVSLVAESSYKTTLTYYHAPTPQAEAEFVVQQIEEFMGGISHFSINSGRGGDDSKPGQRSFQDIVVLYRMSFQSQVLGQAMERRGIPFQAVSITPFFLSSETKPAFYWIMASVSQEIVYPISLFNHIKGIGKTSINRVEQELPLKCNDLWDRLSAMSLPQKVIERFKEIKSEIDSFIKKSKGEGIRPALEQAMAFLNMDTGQHNSQRLLELAGAFGRNLEALALHLEQNKREAVYDERAEAVILMTLHAAKGLEFPVVFLTGLEEGVMPRQMDGTICDHEEERRLFYVGLTRAKENLVLTSSAARQIQGKTYAQQPSRFLSEIPSNLIKRAAQRTLTRKAVQRSQLKLF